jgi:hypothetical protein
MSVNLPDGLVRTVLMYGGLKTARKMFGDDHPYVQNRAAQIIAKTIRNMYGVVHSTKVLNERDLQIAGMWLPRVYFCLYPKPFVHRWHKTRSDWKREILSNYLEPDDFERDFTRLELFRLQQRMNPIEIFAIGW